MSSSMTTNRWLLRPNRPGRWLCRFLPSPGIDTPPFEVEVVEDTFNGGLCVRGRWGMCFRIAGPWCSYMEWQSPADGAVLIE